MRLGRRAVLMLVFAAILVLVWIWVGTRGPTESAIGIAHIAKPPAGAAAQTRPDLMQHVFRFPRPIALKSVRLVYLDGQSTDEATGDLSEESEGPTIWKLEPDPQFEPDATQAEHYRSGASVETHLLSLGEPVPGLMRTDDDTRSPLLALVMGGRYRLEVEGEGLDGSYEFIASPYRRR